MKGKGYKHLFLLRIAVYGMLLLLIVIVLALQAQKQQMDNILDIVSTRF